MRRGRARFLLVSGSKGAVYVVDPTTWSCSCPDHHRRGAGCKFSVAVAWETGRRRRGNVSSDVFDRGFARSLVLPRVGVEGLGSPGGSAEDQEEEEEEEEEVA